MIKKINEPNGHRPPVFQVTFPEGQAIQNSKIPCQKKKKRKEEGKTTRRKKRESKLSKWKMKKKKDKKNKRIKE